MHYVQFMKYCIVRRHHARPHFRFRMFNRCEAMQGSVKILSFSQWNAYHGPSNARLFFMASGGKTGAWSSKINDRSQWIQVDLREKFQVTKMATQGRQDLAQWVTQYKVSYSSDGKIFTPQSKVSKCKGKLL